MMHLSRAANRASKTLLRRGFVATNRMASTLVISEPLNADGSTPAGTQSTVTAATRLGDNAIHLLVVGDSPPTKIPQGVSKVLHVPIGDKLSETVANAVLEAASNDDCNLVVGTASKFGSTVVPRAAALLDVSPVTDILEIQDESECAESIEMLSIFVLGFMMNCTVLRVLLYNFRIFDNK